MEVTFTYTRDDETEVQIRAAYHRGSRDTFSAPGSPASVEVYEANEGNGWVPVEHVDGIDLDAAEQSAWDAVDSKLSRLEA
jgi:hypothetical protein